MVKNVMLESCIVVADKLLQYFRFKLKSVRISTEFFSSTGHEYHSRCNLEWSVIRCAALEAYDPQAQLTGRLTKWTWLNIFIAQLNKQLKCK